MFINIWRNGIKKGIVIGLLLIGMITLTACSKENKVTDYEVEAAKQAKYEKLTYQKAKLGEAAREEANLLAEQKADPDNIVSISNERNGLTIECGTDSVKIDEEGLHIDSRDGKVDITNEGIHVDDKMGNTRIYGEGIKVNNGDNSVNISTDGIYVMDGEETELKIDFPGISINQEVEGAVHDTFLSNLLPEIIADAQGEVDFLDFSKMDTQLMEQNITIDGVNKKIKIYVKDGFFITMNCSEEYTAIHGLTLEKTETDKQGNVYRYYRNDYKE